MPSGISRRSEISTWVCSSKKGQFHDSSLRFTELAQFIGHHDALDRGFKLPPELGMSVQCGKCQETPVVAHLRSPMVSNAPTSYGREPARQRTHARVEGMVVPPCVDEDSLRDVGGIGGVAQSLECQGVDEWRPALVNVGNDGVALSHESLRQRRVSIEHDSPPSSLDQ